MASNFDYDPAWKPEGQGSSSFDFDPNWAPTKKPEGGLVASLKQTGGQMVKSAGQLAADVLPGVDRDNALTRTGQGIIDANPTAVHSLADVADSPWTATKEAVGNAAASVSGVVGARLLGQGLTAAAPLAGPAAPLVAGIGQGISWLGPTAMAALPSYGGIREQQIAADPNNEGSLASKALAGAGAATVGLIENRFGPQEWALKALSQGGRDALAKRFAANSLAGAIGKGAVKGAAIEGAEELVQNPIEQLASYQDPTTSANLQDTAFGGVMGALGGGVLGGGAGGLSRTITPSQAQQPAQPPQPAIDPNAGPLSKAASMATQTPELSPLAFTPMEPTDPELETDAQTQERLRAAQFQADAMPFEPSISFEQGPQPVRATNQDGIPFERISPEDYDTLNPIRAGEGELLDSERPTAGRTRAPDSIEGQAQRRIGVADDRQQGNQSPVRTLGERVQPAQGENASTRALPYFTDDKAEQSARKALPFATEQGAQKKAAELSKKRNEPFTVIPHPALADRFAVVPFRNLRTPNEQGQAAQLAARAQAGQPGAMPRVEQGAQQSAPDGLAAPAPATPVQTQPSTESVSNGLPPVKQVAQEAEAARGQEGAAGGQAATGGVANQGGMEFARSSLQGEPASWVIRNKETGEVVMETYDRAKVDALNTKKYEAVPIQSYLGSLNRRPTPAAPDQPQSQQPQAPQAPQFDVSTRTDDQLRYLTVSGKPGWKEAAQSELARRQGTPQPQAPQSDQFGNANKMVEQPSTKQEGRREEVAPKPKNQTLDSLQAEYDKAKSALDAIGPEPYQPKKRGSNPTEEDAKAFDEAQKRYRSWRNKYLRLKKAEVDASNRLFYAKKAEQQQSETTAREEAQAEQSPSDRFRAEVERRKQERDKEFVHNGVRIYPATINVAGERKQMWGVESSENKAKREAGERYGFGDSLFDTKEQATAAADRQIQRDAERAEFERRKTEIEAEKQAEAAARKADTINGFLDGKAPNTQELIRKALNKQYRFDGVIRSVRQQVEWLNENGTLDVRTFEEPKIKPMSRTQFNRASQREQDAHEKKMREAGTKTVYLVSGSELGKYAYDYAQHLIARKTATPQQAQEQPKQAERVEQPSAPAAQEAQPEQAESFPVNPELESLFESLDGTSTRKANKAKKAIQSDPRADKINMVQDKFLDILQALEDSGAVKINCK